MFGAVLMCFWIVAINTLFLTNLRDTIWAILSIGMIWILSIQSDACALRTVQGGGLLSSMIAKTHGHHLSTICNSKIEVIRLS